MIQGPGGPTEDTTGGFEQGGWVFGVGDDVIDPVLGGLFKPPYALLLGRRTYDIFAGYWPFVEGEMAGLGDALTAADKHVVTHSDQPLAWANSHRLDSVVAVRTLKESDGPDLLIQGSSTLYPPLLAAGLIDELVLMTFPVVLGAGKRLFSEGTQPGALRLLDHRVGAKGVIVTRWAPGLDGSATPCCSALRTRGHAIMRGRIGLAGLTAVLLLAGSAVKAAPPPPLERASIADIDAAMAAGQLSSEQLVRFYLDRIARLDRAGPALHAVIAVNPDAIAQARALDAERRAGHVRGPLHGVPILLKDNIETADRMATTAGSLALAANVTGHDAPLAARLRAAGAIILGKTNLTEWANFRSSHATSGWSAVGGLVRNPYALDRSACGSSSGSAVAVAAGLAAAAVGSETDGSVTCPSSMEGVTGLKPSLGLIARTRIVPISHSQDTAGPIAHTAADAALLAAVMAGPDPADPPSQAPAAAAAALALAQVRPADLRGVRLGVLRFAPESYPGLDALYAQALERLRASGAVLVEIKLPDDPRLGPDETKVLETEMKADMAVYLAGAAPAVRARTLADLIAFNRATPAETRLFGQDLFEASQATRGLADPAYLAARAESLRITGAEGIDRLLAEHRLDALVSPTTGPAWKVDLVYGDASPAAVASFPAVAGYPHVTTPMGLAGGLPVGLSFIGPKWSDGRVLALAEAWEAQALSLPSPQFPASVDPAP